MEEGWKIFVRVCFPGFFALISPSFWSYSILFLADPALIKTENMCRCVLSARLSLQEATG